MAATFAKDDLGTGKHREVGAERLVWALATILVIAPASKAPAADEALDDLLGSEASAAKSREEGPRAGAPSGDATGAGPPIAESRGPETGSRASRRPVIEEIIVTAQKREEGIRDVPISMSVIDAEFIARQGITDLQDLSVHVPNFQVTDSSLGIRPRIRGFTTDPTNLGFEQAVGIVIDGIAYGRGDFFQAGLFDMDQVEVLRGPQGYLFGKNATVGLLNVATKRPTDEYSGLVDAQVGDLGRRRVEAAVGGPALPGFLNVRVAGLFEERDGYVANTTHEVADVVSEFLARERNGFRVKAELPDLAGARLGLSYERAAYDIIGTGNEITEMPEDVKDFMRRFDPNTDFEPDNFVASQEFAGLQERETDVLVADVTTQLAGWGIDAIFGFSRLDSLLQTDDATPAPLIRIVTNDLVEQQTTVELRGTSPSLAGLFGLAELFDYALGTSDFTVGIAFQRRVMDPVDFSVDVFVKNLGELILINNASGFGSGLGAIPDPAGVSDDYVETHQLFFDQTVDSLAGFGQWNWHFAERWTLLYGMRLNHDWKSASWDVMNSGPGGSPSIVISAVQGPNFQASESMKQLNFAPRVGGRYEWSDDIDLYATWSQSFRSAGFNTANASTGDNTRVYDKEDVTSWEWGAKTRLLGGAATWNLGFFHMTLTDFQFFTFDPGNVLPLTFVENAGELRAMGIETDFNYLPTDWLSVRGSLGVNDSEFIEFPQGACVLDRPNTDGDEDERCDLSGGPLENAPKWEASLTPGIDVPISAIAGPSLPRFLDGVALTSSLTVEYQDTKLLDQSLDPRTRQGSFFRLSGSLGFGSAAQGWSLGVGAENLTDEAVAAGIGPVQQCAGCFVQLLQPPRTVFGRFRWDF